MSRWGERTKIRIDICCSFGGILGLGFGGADSFPSLGNMTIYGLVGIRVVLGRVSIG